MSQSFYYIQEDALLQSERKINFWQFNNNKPKKLYRLQENEQKSTKTKNEHIIKSNTQLNLIIISSGSILNDFRKTKYKCVEIAQLINIQMPKQEYFKNIQKGTLRKMDLLDITGLVNLKNELVRGFEQRQRSCLRFKGN